MATRKLPGASGGRASPVSLQSPGRRRVRSGAGTLSGARAPVRATRRPEAGPAAPVSPSRRPPIRRRETALAIFKPLSRIFPVSGNPLLYVRNHIDNPGPTNPWQGRSAFSNETVECHRWRRALAAMGAFGRSRHGSRRVREGREGGAPRTGVPVRRPEPAAWSPPRRFPRPRPLPNDPKSSGTVAEIPQRTKMPQCESRVGPANEARGPRPERRFSARDSG